MIWPIFIVGGFWFWVLLAASFVLMVGLVEVWDRYYSAGFTVVLVLLALTFLGDFNVFKWMYQNPDLMAGGGVAYFVIGTVWSFVKWYIFVRDRKEDLEDERHDFKKSNNLNLSEDIPEDHLEKWYEVLSNKYGTYSFRRRQGMIPNARDHKSRILAWMTYWPWSMTFSLLADLVRQVFNTIYSRLSTTYQRISESIFGDAAEEFAAVREFEKRKEEKENQKRWGLKE